MAIAFVNTASAATTSAVASLAVTITTTAGNTVIVCVCMGTGNTVDSVTDSGGSLYSRAQTLTGSNTTAEIWFATNCQASTSVTVNYHTTQANGPVVVGTYSGVSAIGASANASATSTTATIALTTQDANNFVVAALCINSNPAVTTTTGNARGTLAASTIREVSLFDNTSAGAGSVTNTGTITSNAWAAIALELRTVSGVKASGMMQGMGK